jgi:hypothetical protein
MTPQEWAEKQRQKIPVLLNAINQELITLHFEKTQRIFTQGRLGDDGNTRFRYRGKALYVNPANSPKAFAPAGNPKAKRKKKNPKTRYFTSYAAFRVAVGRNPAYVDLTLFGTLRGDYTASLRRTSEVTWEERLKNPKNFEKIEGLKGRYGTFTNYNTQEVDRLKERILARRKQIGI